MSTTKNKVQSPRDSYSFDASLLAQHAAAVQALKNTNGPGLFDKRTVTAEQVVEAKHNYANSLRAYAETMGISQKAINDTYKHVVGENMTNEPTSTLVAAAA